VKIGVADAAEEHIEGHVARTQCPTLEVKRDEGAAALHCGEAVRGAIGDINV